MRIRWTEEERNALINHAATAMMAKQVFSTREALINAQQAIPKDRRRTIAALSQVPWFTDGVPARIREMEHQQKDSCEEKLQQAVQHTEQKARDDLEDVIAAFVGKILAKAIRSAMREPELVSLFNDSPISSLPAIRRMAHPSRVKLPRVIVAGTLNSQAKTIEAAFEDKLDIRFWSKDQSNDTLKSMLAHADAAIGMVGFLSHAHDAVLKASKVPYTPVSGGVTQVKQALERLLETA
jgi:hypothetical protein